MTSPIRDWEVLSFELGHEPALNSQRATVCLVAADEPPSQLVLRELVDKFVPLGCGFFMAWGQAADKVHDALDILLEQEEHLEVVTTSHQGEPAREVAWFLMKASMPGIRPRVLVGYDRKTQGVGELLYWIDCIGENRAGAAS